MLEGKTVLITGATGLLGSRLAGMCLARGARVLALGRSEAKLEKCFAQYKEDPNLVRIAADVTAAPLPVREGVDYIFHAAGPIERTVIEEQPMQVIGPNVFGTGRLLELLREQQQRSGRRGRMVIFSSATVYGGAEGRDRRVTEEDTSRTEPLDSYNAPYSQSKRMAEVLARAYTKQYGVETVIGRFGYVYGYNICHPQTAFFEFLQTALRGEDICINSTRLARRDNIYVDDAVSGALLLACKGVPGAAYNVSANAQGGSFAAADEIAQAIAAAAGGPVRVARRGTVEHLPGVILDNQKLKALGWAPQKDLKSGIAAVFEQCRKTL